MGRVINNTIDKLKIEDLREAYKSNEDFKAYVDKSKFPDLDTALQNKMVKYYYLYLQEKPVTT